MYLIRRCSCAHKQIYIIIYIYVCMIYIYILHMVASDFIYSCCLSILYLTEVWPLRK